MTNGFIKKTPFNEIKLAHSRRKDYLKKEMSDLKKYIDKRKRSDKEFAFEYDAGYEHFKIGAMLR